MLRRYQSDAISAIERHWRSGLRGVLYVAPTGSGKTYTLAHLLRRVTGAVLFVAPWRQLVVQGVEKLRAEGVDAAPVGRKPPPNRVHVATIETARRRKLPSYSLVVIDEAHCSAANGPRTLLQRYPYAKLLGLTATPLRLDGKPLDAFQVIVETATTESLIRDGYLVPTRVYAPPVPIDLSDVAYDRTTRDYAVRPLSHVMSRPQLVGDAVDHWRRLAWGKRTFVYCCTRAHAAVVRERFRVAGIESAVIDGTTPKRRRAELLSACERRVLPVLVNVAVLIEGIDLPALECEVILRPTLSTTLHLQMVGRGLRPSPGKKDCLYLDHADNFRRHGFPEERRQWSLTGVPRGTGEGSGVGARAKTCPECGAVVPMGTRLCPHCGWAWLPEEQAGLLKLLRVKFA